MSFAPALRTGSTVAAQLIRRSKSTCAVSQLPPVFMSVPATIPAVKNTDFVEMPYGICDTVIGFACSSPPAAVQYKIATSAGALISPINRSTVNLAKNSRGLYTAAAAMDVSEVPAAKIGVGNRFIRTKAVPLLPAAYWDEPESDEWDENCPLGTPRFCVP